MFPFTPDLALSVKLMLKFPVNIEKKRFRLMTWDFLINRLEDQNEETSISGHVTRRFLGHVLSHYFHLMVYTMKWRCTLSLGLKMPQVVKCFSMHRN